MQTPKVGVFCWPVCPKWATLKQILFYDKFYVKFVSCSQLKNILEIFLSKIRLKLDKISNDKYYFKRATSKKKFLQKKYFVKTKRVGIMKFYI